MSKIIWVVWMLCAVPAMAQQINLEALDNLAAKAKEKTIVTLDESSLKTASGLLSDKTPQEAAAKQVTEGLKAVTVRSFEFESPGAFTRADLQPIRDQLKAPQWKRIISVQEDTEETEIWISQGDTNATNGLLILSIEETEVTVVNVVGNINLNNLGMLGGQLGIPQISGPGARSK